jgi:hypothetical protein
MKKRYEGKYKSFFLFCKLFCIFVEIIFKMSWVIVNIETGEAVLETFNKGVISRLNTAKYKAVPIAEYLGTINIKP